MLDWLHANTLAIFLPAAHLYAETGLGTMPRRL